MLLKELVKKYKIPVENIYNMDKKGIQLSIGACIGAFIDCDQANVYNIKHGSRELVTIIKTVCADGLFLWPSVIYQAMHHDHEWSQNNPCDARYVEYKSLSCYNIFKGFLWVCHTHQKVGLIRSWGWDGSKRISSHRLQPGTTPMDTASLSLMATTLMEHMNSANLLLTIISSSSACHHIPPILFSPLMLVSLDHWHLPGRSRSMRHIASLLPSRNTTSLNTIRRLMTKQCHLVLSNLPLPKQAYIPLILMSSRIVHMSLL